VLDLSHNRNMSIAKLCWAALIIGASAFSAAAVEMVRPFEVLESARRDRIELEKRMKREEAEQRQREKEEKARQKALSKRDAASAQAAQGSRPSSTKTVQPQPTTGQSPPTAMPLQPSTDQTVPSTQTGQP
jgi:hypothetical protein